jgi:hypothetical protein
MTTLRTHFTFRVDTWTPDGESIVEHVAGVEDYRVALATYRAACERWPATPIALRQGARVSRTAGACAWCRLPLEPNAALWVSGDSLQVSHSVNLSPAQSGAFLWGHLRGGIVLRGRPRRKGTLRLT